MNRPVRALGWALKGVVPGALALLLLLAPPAGAEVIDRIVAVINDSIITLSELNAATTLASEDPGTKAGKGKDGGAGLEKEVLDKLIEQKLIKQAADKAGIEVSEKEIDNAVEEVGRQNNLSHEQLLFALAQSGLSYREYREQLREQIRQVKFINKEFRSRITVQAEDIEGYYRQNLKEFYGPPTVRIRMIFLSSRDKKVQAARAKEISEGLEKGTDFAELARHYSDGAASKSGGDLGFLKPGELDPDLEDAVSALEPGQVSGQIKKPEGVYIIKLVERRPGEPRKLETVRGAIHERLFNKAMEDRFRSWLMDVKRYAHIEIRL